MVAAFALVIGFTYSDDVVEFVDDLTGGRFGGAGPWLVFALDCVLVAVTAALKWRMSDDTDPGMFLRRMVIGRWGLAAALVVATHLTFIATAAQRARLGTSASLGINLLGTLVFLTALTLLLVSALSDKADRGTSSWVAPIVLGTVVAQLASALWYPVINREPGCAGEVASWYFSDMAHITPVLLLTLGIELGYLRRNSATLDAGQRVAPLLTVIMLGISELLALSMMVKADRPKCGLAAVWHEYIAFVFTAQAMTIGLATVMWMLISNPGGWPSRRSGDGDDTAGRFVPWR